MVSLTRLAYCAALLAGRVVADTCSKVEKNTNIDLYRQSQTPYITEQTEYWSTACSALDPSCIIYPKTSEEVSEIVHILNGNREKFAIKSGGHNPNNYFSSIAGGPLISTKQLNTIALDHKTGKVRVGPGNRWDDVAVHLNGTGWSVVGGRIGNVGVGGYLLGGGLSFMTQEYGWAASSILEMEIVLANGTITTASATKNHDLFKVLKGGGNNFGIVTSYLLQGYRQGQVYGGTLLYTRSEDTDAKMLAAIRDFTENNKDNKAAIIATANRAVARDIDIWIIFVYYNGPSPPGVTFDSFIKIGPTLNTLHTQSYADLLVGNNAYVTHGSIYTIGTETFPIPSAANGAQVMGDLHAHWRNVSSEASEITGSAASFAYQPFPKRMARISRQKSEDLIDLDDEVDRIILDMNYSFVVQSDADKIDKIMRETYGGVRKKTRKWQRKGKLESNAYLPLFMNDCFYPQDYFGRLRPRNHELAKCMAEELDPRGFFRMRTGGLKP
ncbi:Fc.00g024770.m01.CDS01 [Cosmosporella sp. VM-42]